MVIEPNETRAKPMIDDTPDAPALDPPDADTVYAHYLETCRRVGVEPVPRERAQDLIREWSETIARGGEPLH